MLSRFLAALGLITACVVPARAQAPDPVPKGPTPTPTPDGPIQMELDSPLAFTQKPLSICTRFGKWFPVAVKLKNTGDTVSGEVRMRLLSDGGFYKAPDEFATTVELPSQSNKVVWIYGRMERDDARSVEITFSGRGFKGLTEKARLENLDPSQRLVLSVTDGDERISYLSAMRGPGMALSEPQNRYNNQTLVRPLTTGKENVPDRWIGFESVDLLVLGDFAHIELRPLQIQAIHNYATGGGTMLVPAGSKWQRLAQSPLADLWPLKLESSVSASPTEVATIARQFVPNPRDGADRLGGAPVVLARGALKNEAVLKDGTAAAPLFAVQETGAGRCLMLSYDPTQPPFIGWRGLPDFWRDVFANTAKVRRLESIEPDAVYSLSNPVNNYGFGGGGGYYAGQPTGQTTATSVLFTALAKAPQLRMPPVSQIAWFLALYVFFLVPVNYAVLRYFDRRELAWITIPAIVVAFSFLAYQTALSLRGRAILTRQVDLVQGTVGSNEARTDSLLWLFSPRKTTYDISSAVKTAAVVDYLSTQREPSSITIQQPEDGSSFVAEGASVLMWADRPFYAQSVVDLGKGIAFTPGDEPTLRNNTPYDLSGAVLVDDGRVRPFGTVAAGKSATASKGDGISEMDASMLGRIQEASSLEGIFDDMTRANGIPGNALSAAIGQSLGRFYGGGLIVAWSAKPAAALTFPGHPGGRDVTLFLFRVPATNKNRVAAREALVNLVSYTPAPVNGGNAMYAGRSGGEAIYNVVLPAGATFRLDARGQGLGTVPQDANYDGVPDGTYEVTRKITLDVWNPATSGWVPLPGRVSKDKSPTGGWNFSGSLPRAYARRPDGQVRVKVNLGKGSARVSSLRVRVGT